MITYIFGMGSNNNLDSNNNLGSYWLRAGPFRLEQQLSSSEAFLLPVLLPGGEARTGGP